MNITQAVSARTSGLAMRALAGMWAVGMTSKRLPIQMKKNIEISIGR